MVVSVFLCVVSIGWICVCLPVSLGGADYIMIDGFKQLVGRNAANK